MTVANDTYADDAAALFASKAFQPPATTATETYSLADWAVQGSIVLSALATGLALNRHGEFTTLAASTAAAAIGATLLMTHAALRRRSVVSTDAARLAALETALADLVKLRRETATTAGQPVAAAVAREPSAPVITQAPAPSDDNTRYDTAFDNDAMEDNPYTALADSDHDAAVDDLVRRLAEGFDAAPADLDAIRGLAPAVPPRQALPVVAPRPVDAAPVAAKSSAVAKPEAKSTTTRHRALQEIDPVAPAAVEPTAAARPDPRLAIPVARGGDPELAQAIERAIVDGEIDYYLQPIARLGDRKARFYEVFPRLKGSKGDALKPEEYVPAAEFAGLSRSLEESILAGSLELLQKLSDRGKAKPFFFSLSRTALGDAGTRDGILALLQRYPSLIEYLVLEVSETDLIDFGDAEHDTLAALTDAGMVFAMKDPHSLDFDTEWLRQRRFAFIKAPAALLIAQGANTAGLGGRLGQAGLQLVIEDIADEIAFAHAHSIGAVLGQGALFSEPRPVRPELLAPVAASA